MARILYGSMVDDIKGSIGGLSFQRNASGPVGRLKPSRIQSPNSLQTDKNIFFSQAVTAWASIDGGQQDEWNIWAAANPKYNNWGDEKYLSGFNYFVSCYCNALSCGASPELEAPDSYAAVSLTNISCPVTSTSIIVTPYSSIVHPNHYLLVFATMPLMTVGINNRKLYRFMQAVAPGTTSSINITTAWKAAFGFASIPSPGSGRYFIQFAVSGVTSDHFQSGAWYRNFTEVTGF
jgi:hypothetical protein